MYVFLDGCVWRPEEGVWSWSYRWRWTAMWVLVIKPLVLCESSQRSSQLSHLSSVLSFFPYSPLMDFVHYNGVLHQQNILKVGFQPAVRPFTWVDYLPTGDPWRVTLPAFSFLSLFPLFLSLCLRREQCRIPPIFIFTYDQRLDTSRSQQTAEMTESNPLTETFANTLNVYVTGLGLFSIPGGHAELQQTNLISIILRCISFHKVTSWDSIYYKQGQFKSFAFSGSFQLFLSHLHNSSQYGLHWLLCSALFYFLNQRTT